MDPSFFGLDGHPFNNASDSTDAKDAYVADAHESLITELKAGLKAPHGITLLIGEEGAGKTMLARSFGEKLADSCTVAYLPSTGPGLRHLLTEIIEQLGGSAPPAGEEPALLESLRSLSRARAEHERSTLVIIDDAHELPAKTIERLGRLFGDDPAEPSMLHVVLVGRPELLDRMNAANDRSILKHLVQVCRMDPIGPEESFRYIADRIAKVGGVVDKLFTEDALRLIVKRANGNPARIDAICSAALEQAAESGSDAVGAETVDLACMGVEGFSLDRAEPARSNSGPETPSYVFGEEEGDDAEEPPAKSANRAKRAGEEASSKSSTQVKGKEKAKGESGGRRRLVVWAAGFVGVLAGFAALMTGTGGDMGLFGGGGPSPVQVAALPGDDEGRANRAQAAAGAEKKVEKAALPARPLATPKLVVTRETPAAAAVIPDARPEAAVPADAKAEPEPQAEVPAVVSKREARAAKAESQRAGSAPVHASPRKKAGRDRATADTAEPTGRPTVASPPYDPAAQPGAQAAAPATERPKAVVVTPTSVSPPTKAVVVTPQAEPGATRSKPAGPAKSRVAGSSPAMGAASPPQQLAAAKPAVVQPAPAAVAPRAQSQPVPPRQVAATVPTPQAAATPSPRPTPAVRPAPQQPTQVAAATPQPPRDTLEGRFTVQVGAFKNRANAEAVLAKVQASYPDGRIVAADVKGSTVFRVVSGAFASKAEADGRARTLTENGFSTYVRSVTP